MKRIVQKISKPKKELIKLSIPLTMLLASTNMEASYSKLAKVANMHPKTLEQIVHKLVKIESTSGKYNTKNQKSGAYGRYQIMPSTAEYYAKKLHISIHQWKKPDNQDKIFNAIMKDNILSLKRSGHKISAFSLYATHQQGAGGFNAIIKNKPLTKKLEKRLRQNLPEKLRKVKKSQLRTTWIRYWKRKVG
ncbi:transglycosylase SLT domain-containing protein [Sulfurovum sp.]|uniref:transglycosylase SLT domain-containing protein n=1 Tax=Sulfurovum sp. TaxID=1969726 RepID=UPI0025F9395E|nr:transglycosylase SLT domain-containing protein [Sulfurovum sp.]